MKRKYVHLIKPVGEQGINPKRNVSSINDAIRRKGEDFPGHCLQAEQSLWEFWSPEKTGNIFGTSKRPKKPARLERRKTATRLQERRPPRRLDGKKNSAACAETSSEKNPPKSLWSLRNPLRWHSRHRVSKGPSRADPSSECPKQTRLRIQRKRTSKVLRYTL